jgi:hypothetical protein
MCQISPPTDTSVFQFAIIIFIFTIYYNYIGRTLALAPAESRQLPLKTVKGLLYRNMSETKLDDASTPT